MLQSYGNLIILPGSFAIDYRYYTCYSSTGNLKPHKRLKHTALLNSGQDGRWYTQ